MSKKILIVLIIILVLIIPVNYIFRYSISSFIADMLAVEQHYEKADVILLFGGDPIRRLPVAYDIYKKGFADTIWFTVTKPGPAADEFKKIFNIYPDPTGIYIQAFKNVNVRKDKYRMFQGPNNTYEDCQYFYKYYKEHPFKKAIVISDPYHTARIKLCLENIFPKSVTFYYAHNSNKDFRLSHPDSNDFVVKVFNESIKYIIYYIKFITIW